MLRQDLKTKIRTIPDFPTPGVNFIDLTTLFSDPVCFGVVIDHLADFISRKNPDKLVAIEARGFIIGAALAGRLGLPFVPVRKPGKLPAEKISISYDLEYGKDALEIHTDAIHPGEKIVIIDDLVATGGTMLATCQLVEQLKGEVCGIVTIAALTFLPFSVKLHDYDLHYLVEYDNTSNI